MSDSTDKRESSVTILLENEGGFAFPFDGLNVAKQVAQKVLELEQCPYEAEINLVLTGDEEIRKANRDFRQIDKETDVLSFPMVEFTKPVSYDILENGFGIYFNPDSGALMLGDIMISVPRAKEQAAQYGHELKREYAFLIAHSILHLLGYDHMSEAEAGVMEKKQETVLQDLKITR